MKKIFTLLSLFAFSYLTVEAQVTAAWTSLTSGTTATLYGVHAPDPNICYVCGAGGIIKKTTNGGVTWTLLTTGTTTDFFYIYFTSNLVGYVVGDNNTALKTINGGTSWTPMTLPVSGLGFRFVTFLDSNTGFIVGGSSATIAGTILKTTNGGSTWTTASISGSTSVMYAVSFSTPLIGYSSEYSGKILKTTNGGTSWSAITSGTTVNIQNIYFADQLNGYAIGNAIVRKTNDAGATWTSAGISGITSDYFPGVDFLNPGYGVIAGGNPTANTGKILTTIDGVNWTTYNTGTSRLYRVDMVNANVGYASGVDGVIMKFSSNVGILESENTFTTFNAYPNPFSESTMIDCSKFEFGNTPTIEIYDMTGKLVNSTTTYSEKIFIVKNEGLTEGNYLYRILDGNQVIGSGKLILQ